MNAVGVNVLAEAERCENANFAACVYSLNVGRRVLFRVAVVLGELESLLKAHILLYHHSDV